MDARNSARLGGRKRGAGALAARRPPGLRGTAVANRGRQQPGASAPAGARCRRRARPGDTQ
eukprot:4001772-Lingulodinium_polyedra.AAC.1